METSLENTPELQTTEECFEAACLLLGPAIEAALAMGSIAGPTAMIDDFQRGLDIIRLGVSKKQNSL